MADPSYLAMTDEDFLKQQAPDDVVAPATETPAQTTQTEVSQGTETKVDEPKNQEGTTEGDATGSAEDGNTDPTGDAGTDSTKPVEGAETADKTTTAQVVDVVKDGDKSQTQGDKAKEVVKDPTKDTAAAPDYEAFYKQIMTPFKANGKMIDLRSPAEAISLMQMGANYTAKMQALVPHRKMLVMLENNGLLDEGKLSYLIDLDKKNPEAIKKLIKDAGMDPTEIDPSVEPAYREGNHRVTDEEAVFRTALDDMKSNPAGLATLQAINTDWDQASKELLWKQPDVMTVIHGQRESGIYDRIVTEMNRQMTLGRIAPGTPFLQSYKTVGDQMVQANAFADLTAPQAAAKAQVAAVATTVATPKPVVTNSAQASAASQTRTAPKSAKVAVNPLAMSDDEFMKLTKLNV